MPVRTEVRIPSGSRSTSLIAMYIDPGCDSGIFGFLPWQKICLPRHSVFWRGYWLVYVQIYSCLIIRSRSNTSVSFALLSWEIDAVILSVCIWFNRFFHSENLIQCISGIHGFLVAQIHKRCVQYFHAHHKGLRCHSVLSPLYYLRLYLFQPCTPCVSLSFPSSQYIHICHRYTSLYQRKGIKLPEYLLKHWWYNNQV